MCLAAPLHELRRTGTYKHHTPHTACSMCVRSRGAAGDEGTAAQQSMNAVAWLCLLVQCTPAVHSFQKQNIIYHIQQFIHHTQFIHHMFKCSHNQSSQTQGNHKHRGTTSSIGSHHLNHKFTNKFHRPGNHRISSQATTYRPSSATYYEYQQ